MAFEGVEIPDIGEVISYDKNDKIQVPDLPYIAYIRGDGIGVDITPVMLEVVNSAVSLAYNGVRKIQWVELFAGENALNRYDDQWLPQATLDALKHFKVSIKGPLTTPVGGGIRSLNVAIRQKLDLYVCIRPVRYFKGSPSPLLNPQKTNMVIFRENSEGIYIGIEWKAGSEEAKQVINFITKDMNISHIPHKDECGVGVKLNSKRGTRRLVSRAIEYAIDNNRKSITLVHKGNIMKYTEGAFRDWAYDLCKEQYGGTVIDNGPWLKIKNPNTGEDIIVKDCIADAFLQQILLRPSEHDVIATMNLNGDYISDALAAQVGGIGISPGANIGDKVAVFEATHGTAPGYAGKDKVNPGSLILSAEMMLRHIGWNEAADLIITGLSKAIEGKTVTYDFARMMEGSKEVSCSHFGKYICEHMLWAHSNDAI